MQSNLNEIISLLYVDDEEVLLNQGKLFLERSGEFRVDIMKSAHDALNSPVIQSYDAIISDYQMPEMDGIEFLKAVRSQFGDIPFVLFTGRGREEVVIEAINNGADFYLQKGGSPKAQFAELTHKIKQAVRRKKAEKSLENSEKQLSDIIESLPDATFAINQTGHVIAWNCAIKEMTGVSSDQILGKGKSEYTIPFYGCRCQALIDLINEPNEIIAQFYSNVSRVGSSITAEKVLPHLHNIVLHIKVSPFYNLAGEITGAIESIRDITESKKSEEVLRESQRMLVEAMDLANLVTWECNLQTGILTFDDRFSTLYGTHVESKGIHHMTAETYMREIVYPEDLKILVEEDEKTRNTTDPHYMSKREYRIIRKDGEIRFIEMCVGVTKDTEGRTIRVHGINQDITDRKNAEAKIARSNEELSIANEELIAIEEELRQNYEEMAISKQLVIDSEQRYRNVVEDQTELICRFLPDGTHIFVNDSYCRYFSLNREKIVGSRFLPNIPVEDQKRLKQFFASITPDHPVDIIVHRIIMPDGTIRWQQWSDRAIFDSRREVIEYQSVGRDVTEEIATREALQVSEERFRSFVENANDILFSLTLDGVFVYISPKATELLGYEISEFIGKPAKFFIHPDDFPRNINFYIQARNLRKKMSGNEYRMRHKDGTWQWHSQSISPVYDSKGNIIKIQGISRDITERIKSEEALRKANCQLSLLSDITRHDILNNITAIYGYLEAIEMEYTDPRVSEYLQKLKRITNKIQSQIEFTGIYQNLGTHEPQWVLLDTIMPLPHLPDSITLTTDLQEISIFGDPMLKVVFFNLLDNSIRHGHRVTRIHVSTHMSENDLIVIWEDNGEGIAKEEKEKIFERGYGKNTGLGMFLVQEILSLTGITIIETGVPGTGARFEIIVPKGAYRFTG
ncbi:MAG: PAS domain S-box protein [Methanospirillum sp.]|uniref:response regulator n=1 Tax=Methanospirillum sp. TaxID=45200 RepID=UPI0023746B13|nr:PAS domain S-box protein [Methanospirillum sp.]MDD1729684.1 PAS domain S-box protein [Methanospirillum sp.]